VRVFLYLLFPLFALCIVSRADAQWVRLSGPGGAYAFTVNGQNIYAGSFGQGVFVSTDEGTDWTAIDSGLTSTDVFALASSGTYLYAGTFLGGMFVSSNSGLTWAPSDSGLLTSSVISLTTYGSDILAGTYANGLFISADSGAIWAPTRLQNLSVYAFAAVGSGMCAGTYGGGVVLSAIGDTAWSVMDSGLTAHNVFALASVGSSVFAGTLGGGMFRSIDAGATWSADDSGLTVSSINALIAVGTNVFAGTDVGIFRSTDMGMYWALVDSLLPVTPVYAFAASGTNLFAGTNGYGIWRRPLAQVVITDVAAAGGGIPGAFRLEQNYPNPFNPSTTIRYNIPRRSYVTLTVFNILGQQVTDLVSAQQDPGFHEIRFDASGLASGIYFYRLTAEGYTSTRKLVVLR
jgi:ligand-binding sensor domain-containing protein